MTGCSGQGLHHFSIVGIGHGVHLYLQPHLFRQGLQTEDLPQRTIQVSEKFRTFRSGYIKMDAVTPALIAQGGLEGTEAGAADTVQEGKTDR